MGAGQTMVRMGELAVSAEIGMTLVSLGLGSCIGLALIDRRAGVAALAHIVLPDSLGAAPDPGTFKFADHAVPVLLERVLAAGAKRHSLVAVLVGGASMFSGGGSTLDVGRPHDEAVRALIAKLRIPIAAEATGGTRGRTIRVDVASGTVTVREAGSSDGVLLQGAQMAVAA